VNEVEEFIIWVLEDEPERYQLYYCLGILNEHFKADYEQAIQDYEVFVERARPGEFVEHVERARSQIGNLMERRGNPK
jgi:hypothetical protein